MFGIGTVNFLLKRSDTLAQWCECFLECLGALLFQERAPLLENACCHLLKFEPELPLKLLSIGTILLEPLVERLDLSFQCSRLFEQRSDALVFCGKFAFETLALLIGNARMLALSCQSSVELLAKGSNLRARCTKFRRQQCPCNQASNGNAYQRSKSKYSNHCDTVHIKDEPVRK